MIQFLKALLACRPVSWSSVGGATPCARRWRQEASQQRLARGFFESKAHNVSSLTLGWDRVRDRYDAIVVSYGGAGTTMLLDFLAPHLCVNDRNSLRDGIKHIDAPDHPALERTRVSRAIYLVSDPRVAALSLFRRDFAAKMMVKLSAKHRTVKEYIRLLESNQPDRADLFSFLERGEDLFGFESHWRNWREGDLPFPVLFVRYDALHEAVPRILEFLGLPPELQETFAPRKARKSRLDELPSVDRARLDAIYGRLAAEIAEGPPFFTREATRRSEQ